IQRRSSASSFTDIKEMTMSIDQHIEELRAELRNAVDADERRWIKEELAMALAEREAIWAEQESLFSSDPPF
ncbi:MAG: hypothetical protein E5V63_34250, partial [Mesorhizobium sp.]